jgi:hypothetical protein
MDNGKDLTDAKSPVPWSVEPQYNYAMAGASPNLYPMLARSPPPPPTFAELSQEAAQPTPELGDEGQRYNAYKSSPSEVANSVLNPPKTEQNSPVEMDAQDHPRQNRET